MTCHRGGHNEEQSTGFSITATDWKIYKKTIINRLSMQHIVIIGIARQEQKWPKIWSISYKQLACGAEVAPDLQKTTISWLFVAAQGSSIGKCYTMTSTKNLLREGKIDRNGNNQPIFGPVVKYNTWCSSQTSYFMPLPSFLSKGAFLLILIIDMMLFLFSIVIVKVLST